MCKEMSTPIEAEKLDELEFEWGKKRGVGGKKRDVRFYESFTYDGMDYTLYDCVYMYKKDEPPYIGKLVKIWENSDKSKKIKVQWFFRPSEISFYLRDVVLMENELLFASGDGSGLANINPLYLNSTRDCEKAVTGIPIVEYFADMLPRARRMREAIAGKCNVVCVSRDSRNPQPSAEELQMADYVFYRIFDVKSCSISDQMDDTVGGLEVKYVFNRTENARGLDVCNLNLTSKDEGRNSIVCGETLKVAGKDPLQQLNDVTLDENDNHMLEKEYTNAEEVRVNKGRLLGASSSGANGNSSDIRNVKGISVEKKSTLGDKSVGCKDGSEKGEFKDIKSPASQVRLGERVKSSRKYGDVDEMHSKKAKHDSTVSSMEVKDAKRSLISPGKDSNLVTGSPSSNGNPNNLDVSEKVVKLAGKPSSLDERFVKTSVPPYEETPRSKHDEDLLGLGKDDKLTKDLNALQGNQSKGTDLVSREKSDLPHAKDFVGAEKNKKLGENLSARTERPSKINVVSPNETLKSGSTKDFQGKLLKTPNDSMERRFKRSVDLSNEKSNSPKDANYENKDAPLANDASPSGGPLTKKGKFDAFVKMSGDRKNTTIENTKEKTCSVEVKTSTRSAAYDNTTKSKLGKDAPKENFDDTVGKPSKSNLRTPSCNGDNGKVGSQIFEVTRRPIVVILEKLKSSNQSHLPP
ncbi:hypothetical protein OROGR_005900 [Orobanche gracilis]